MAVTLGNVARLNLGCGDYPLNGFLNIDSKVHSGVDVLEVVPPIRWPNQSIEEIYCGHFLEHLDREQGMELLREAHRVLVSHGKIGIVVPDFREIARRYIEGDDAPFLWQDGTHDMRDLDEMCHYLLFSSVQESHHLWAYDLYTLGRALERAGFNVIGEIDRYADPRLSTPRWYQCGLEARKP